MTGICRIGLTIFLRQENSFVIKRDVNNGDIIMHLKYFVAILVS